MGMHFNLLEEPWIPCVSHDGHVAELNLRDALVQAHQWREIGTDAPTITVSVQLLLLAVLHRVFGPADREAWAELYRRGSFDATALDAYLSHWHDRFDLFDARHPFYQHAGVTRPENEVSTLLHELNPKNVHFDHRSIDGLAVTPAEAARYLLAAQAYGRWLTKGKYGQLPWGTCARGITFLVKGNSLFEDLCLNLIRYPTRDDVMPCTPADAPCWEMDDPYVPVRTLPLGYLDYLTWLSRKIRLLPEEREGQIVVARAVVAPGLRMTDDLRSPMKQHTRLQTKGWGSWLRFDESRALWRDSAPLFRWAHTDERADTRTTAQIEWLAALVEDGLLPSQQTHAIAAYGVRGDRNEYRVHFYRSEQLPLPLPLLRQQELVDHLEAALGDAEQARNQLWGAASTLASQVLFHKESAGLSTNERQERDRMLQAWAPERRYWSALDLPFTTLVTGLPEGPLEARLAWARTVQRAAWDALEAVMAGLPDDPASFKAGVLASGQLGAGLRKALPILEVETERSDAA